MSMTDKGAEFDWDGITKLVEEAEIQVDMDGNLVKRHYLGSIISLNPSGKYYTPFAYSNVTLEEAEADKEWWDSIEKEAEERGFFLEFGEGDALDVFIGKIIETEDDEEEAEPVAEYPEYVEFCRHMAGTTLDVFEVLVGGFNCGIEREYDGENGELYFGSEVVPGVTVYLTIMNGWIQKQPGCCPRVEILVTDGEREREVLDWIPRPFNKQRFHEGQAGYEDLLESIPVSYIRSIIRLLVADWKREKGEV